MLRWCDPYEIEIPDVFADRTGYVFEEAGGSEADRLTVELEELPPQVPVASVIAATRASASRVMGADPGWPEGQIGSGLGPAHTLAITSPDLDGAMWVAALRDGHGRVWTLRFESAREGAEAVFAAIVAALGGGAAPAGWAPREAFALPLSLPTWLRPPRVYRFASPDGAMRCALDQGSADMPEESEFEAWGEAAPGEVLVVHALGGGEAPLAGTEGVWGQWRLDRCDAYGGVLGSTWARVAASPGLSLRLVVIERDAEALGESGFAAMAASVRRR